MQIAIIGGHDRMVQQYKTLCAEYHCNAKVFTQPTSLKRKLGSPDMLILFTSTVSHKSVKNALSLLERTNTDIIRSHTSSLSALRKILVEHTQTA